MHVLLIIHLYVLARTTVDDNGKVDQSTINSLAAVRGMIYIRDLKAIMIYSLWHLKGNYNNIMLPIHPVRHSQN